MDGKIILWPGQKILSLVGMSSIKIIGLFCLGGAIMLITMAAINRQEAQIRILPPPVSQTILPPASNTLPATEQPAELTHAPEVVAEGLTIPWEIAFLADGRLLVTERPGRLLLIGSDRTVIPVSGVHHSGEGGLLGLALHPDFSSNGWLYLYLTTQKDNKPINRVERYRLADDRLNDRAIIIDDIPGANLHDGGRLSFGSDKLLYVTTGDAGDENNAQDKNSLAGKILRVRDDGAIPPNNPFNNAVYSYGHRNPQGLAWDSADRLWATEHGRSGLLSGYDEINLIEPGKNYGWPIIQGDETKSGLVIPRLHSGARTTWAPSGAVFYDNKLLFAGLRGEAIYQATISNNLVTSVTAYFQKQFGRLRTVALGSDGWVYIMTNNRDGRGQPKAGDDKIIRINPAFFKKTAAGWPR